MSIGENIRSYRKQSKLTQIKLAEKAQMSRSYLADLEADRYNPSVETLKMIADALGTQVHILMGESAEAPTSPEWATAKDKRDFKKMLEEDAPVMFDGVPIEGEAKQRVMDVLTGLFWEAKQMNKKTYGRKKKSQPEDNDTEK